MQPWPRGRCRGAFVPLLSVKPSETTTLSAGQKPQAKSPKWDVKDTGLAHAEGPLNDRAGEGRGRWKGHEGRILGPKEALCWL